MLPELDRQISLVAPIHGVSIGDKNNKSTWRVDFKEGTTPEQMAAAQAVIDAFDGNAIDALVQQAQDRQRVARTEMELATQLRNLTPQQAADYVQNNVNDLATAKTVLKIMARLLVALWDYTIPNHHSGDPSGMTGSSSKL